MRIWKYDFPSPPLSLLTHPTSSGDKEDKKKNKILTKKQKGEKDKGKRPFRAPSPIRKKSGDGRLLGLLTGSGAGGFRPNQGFFFLSFFLSFFLVFFFILSYFPLSFPFLPFPFLVASPPSRLTISPSSPELGAAASDKPYVDKWGFVRESPLLIREVLFCFVLFCFVLSVSFVCSPSHSPNFPFFSLPLNRRTSYNEIQKQKLS